MKRGSDERKPATRKKGPTRKDPLSHPFGRDKFTLKDEGSHP